jgi:hypothetical protein
MDKQDKDNKADIAELADILHCITELDSAIEGGIESILSAEEEDVLSSISSMNMKLMKNRGFLVRIQEKLFSLSEENAIEGHDSDNPRLTSKSMYYKRLAEVVGEVLKEDEENSYKDAEKGLDKVEASSKLATRRRLMGSLGALSVGAIVVGGMAAPNKAEALGDSAALIPFLKKLVADSQVDTYSNFFKQIQNLQKLFGGLQALHGAFINGIDGLLMGNSQDSSKEMVTNVTAQEKIADTVRESTQVNIEINSVVGSGTCIQDSVETVDKALNENEAKAPVLAGQSSVDKYILGKPKSTAQERGEEIAKDVKRKNGSSFNGATIANTPISNTEKAKSDSMKVYSRTIEKHPKLIITELDRLSSQKGGMEYASAISTYLVRRGVAEGAHARLRQGNIKEPEVYNHMVDKLDAIISGTPTNSNDEAAVVNSRLIAMANEMKNTLADIGSKGEGAPGISLMESLSFQVQAKNNATFYEYIRSTGPGIAPLLREMVDMQGTALKFLNYSLQSDREVVALLSNILLELQDSPQRIQSVNSLSRKK